MFCVFFFFVFYCISLVLEEKEHKNPSKVKIQRFANHRLKHTSIWARAHTFLAEQ
jgi:hypothetical protein